MARILVVGTAVLDLVFTVPRHPAEDEELRAAALRVCAGGNAVNSAIVLRGLRHEVALGAVLGDDPAGGALEAGLQAAGVDLSPCRRVAGMPPVSAILLHEQTGSRTIVHHRGAPEYDLEDLAPHDLSPFRWAHLEARPGKGTARILRHLGLFHPGLLVSVEVEKTRQGIEEVLPLARLAIFSRGFAEETGAAGPGEFLRGMRARVPRTLLAVAWGAEGAWGLEGDDALHHAPPHPPPRVVDTIGAGDTFNAGMIDALARGRPFAEALDAGCRLAGEKTGRVGPLPLQPGPPSG